MRSVGSRRLTQRDQPKDAEDRRGRDRDRSAARPGRQLRAAARAYGEIAMGSMVESCRRRGRSSRANLDNGVWRGGIKMVDPEAGEPIDSPLGVAIACEISTLLRPRKNAATRAAWCGLTSGCRVTRWPDWCRPPADHRYDPPSTLGDARATNAIIPQVNGRSSKRPDAPMQRRGGRRRRPIWFRGDTVRKTEKERAALMAAQGFGRKADRGSHGPHYVLRLLW
jgi:hypothetical protein